jgi:anthranilate/para-aminobenzoate synthase component I
MQEVPSKKIHAILTSVTTVVFQAGGGIVADLDPRDEYEETWHKKQIMWLYMLRTTHTEGGRDA